MSDKSTTEKINVRSPFYITASAEGAPEAPAVVSDPVDDPTIPAEYVEPEKRTLDIQCGDTVKVGQDVGVRQYNLDVGTATGDITINYTVNVPVSITGYWNTSIPSFASTGYIGNDDFEQELLDAGIDAVNMNLGTGQQTGTLTISKTAETPSGVTILVSAPLPTDDYQFTATCPSAPAISAPANNLPQSSDIPSSSDPKFVEDIAAFYIDPGILESGENLFNVEIKVNGVTAHTINTGTKGYYVFSDYDGLGNFYIGDYDFEDFTRGSNGVITRYSTPTTYLAQSDYFNTDLNKIELIMTSKSGTPTLDFSVNPGPPYIRYIKSGVIYDTDMGKFRYATNFIDDARAIGYFESAKAADGMFVSDLTPRRALSLSETGGYSHYGWYNQCRVWDELTWEFNYRKVPSGAGPATRAGLDDPYVGEYISGALSSNYDGRIFTKRISACSHQEILRRLKPKAGKLSFNFTHY